MLKNLTPLLLLAVLLVTGYAQADAQEVHSGKDNPLIGPIRIEQLFDLEGWFGGDFMSYVPDRSYTALLKEYLEGITIKCFMGTWCEDSQIQVPRMLKILQQAGVDPAQFEMYGLDEDKKSPEGLENQYNIEKVPTFVLVYKGDEIGRIVEEPIGTLEKDLVGLIMKAFPEEYPFYEGNQPKHDATDQAETDVGPDGSVAAPPTDGEDAPPKDPHK